jgi:hypothetical protein
MSKSFVVKPAERAQPPSFVPSYLRRYWNQLERNHASFSKRENRLLRDRAESAEMEFDLIVLSKIAEPTTEGNKLEKGKALVQVVDMLENLDFAGVYPSELRKYLGVPNSQIRKMLTNGVLTTFECGGVTLVSVDTVTSLLAKWARELGVEATEVEGC